MFFHVDIVVCFWHASQQYLQPLSLFPLPFYLISRPVFTMKLKFIISNVVQLCCCISLRVHDI